MAFKSPLLGHAGTPGHIVNVCDLHSILDSKDINSAPALIMGNPGNHSVAGDDHSDAAQEDALSVSPLDTPPSATHHVVHPLLYLRRSSIGGRSGGFVDQDPDCSTSWENLWLLLRKHHPSVKSELQPQHLSGHTASNVRRQRGGRCSLPTQCLV